MANHTLSDRFPEGADISVFEDDGQIGSQPGPEGTAVATGTVASGDVTFSGLDEGKTYIAFNDADETQNVRFVVDVPSTALASDAAAEITGDWDFSGDLVTSGTLNGTAVPIAVAGVRDDPESALAALLTALESAGLITDSTTAT